MSDKLSNLVLVLIFLGVLALFCFIFIFNFKALCINYNIQKYGDAAWNALVCVLMSICIYRVCYGNKDAGTRTIFWF